MFVVLNKLNGQPNLSKKDSMQRAKLAMFDRLYWGDSIVLTPGKKAHLIYGITLSNYISVELGLTRNVITYKHTLPRIARTYHATSSSYKYSSITVALVVGFIKSTQDYLYPKISMWYRGKRFVYGASTLMLFGTNNTYVIPLLRPEIGYSTPHLWLNPKRRYVFKITYCYDLPFKEGIDLWRHSINLVVYKEGNKVKNSFIKSKLK